MLFILSFILLCIPVLASRQDNILQVITDNVQGHSQLRNGTAMCTIIKHRLSKKGIFFASVAECLAVEIDSEYGSTLLEVYSMFDRAEAHFLKKQQDVEYEDRMQVKHECNLEFMFHRGIVQWSMENAPDIVLGGCYTNAMLYRETPTNCTVINNSSKLHSDFQTLPFDLCLTALEKLSAQRMKVREEHRLQRELPVTVGMEVAKIWRYQMPSKLESISKIIELKYP